MIILFSTSASKIIRFESEEKYLRKIRPIKYADVESRRIRPNRDFDATPFNHRRLIEMVKRRNDFNWNFWRRAHTHTHNWRETARASVRIVCYCCCRLPLAPIQLINTHCNWIANISISWFHVHCVSLSFVRSSVGSHRIYRRRYTFVMAVFLHSPIQLQRSIGRDEEMKREKK